MSGGLFAAILGQGMRENPDHGPCVQNPGRHDVFYHQDAEGYLWSVRIRELTWDRDGKTWFSAESCS